MVPLGTRRVLLQEGSGSDDDGRSLLATQEVPKATNCIPIMKVTGSTNCIPIMPAA
jgi:hypothetical protein